jgi:hypothetical protein
MAEVVHDRSCPKHCTPCNKFLNYAPIATVLSRAWDAEAIYDLDPRCPHMMQSESLAPEAARVADKLCTTENFQTSNAEDVDKVAPYHHLFGV